MSPPRRRHALAAALTAGLALAVSNSFPVGPAGAHPQPPSQSGPLARPAPPAEPAPPGGVVPVFPRPGGGRNAIHVLGDGFFWSSEPQSYLLDPATGQYRRLPYPNLVLAPDRRTVAVEDVEGRIGVVGRHQLLTTGDAAVRWTDLPPGSPAWWSPDGTALLVTTLEKGPEPPGTFTAHRYDLRSGRIRSTPVELDCDICVAGWAADSRRYVVMLRGADPAVAEGPIQYLHPDGSPGPMLGADGILRTAGAYSPSRRYAIVEPVRPLDPPPPPAIVDLRTGAEVTTVDAQWPLLGWYDEHHVVRVAPGTTDTVLEVVDVRTGAVTTRVDAPGLPPYYLQLGSARQLRGQAAELGF